MIQTTRLSGALRIITGITLVMAVIAAGYLGRSPWIILPLTLAFTLSFLTGRLILWLTAMREESTLMLVKAVIGTALIQLVVVAFFYLIGLGLGAFLGGYELRATLDRADWLWPFGLGVVASISGLVIGKLEAAQTFSVSPEPTLPIKLLDLPVTPDTFFHPRTPDDEITQISEAGISAIEDSLGLALPDTLRQIYRKQDGGYLRRMCLVEDGAAPPQTIMDVFDPFGGSSTLDPCSSLEPLATSFSNIADPDNKDAHAHLFTDGTDKMALLAQWYMQSLFLDYNQPGPPRIGFVDFDDVNWASHVRYWADFDTFFSQLRLYEEGD